MPSSLSPRKTASQRGIRLRLLLLLLILAGATAWYLDRPFLAKQLPEVQSPPLPTAQPVAMTQPQAPDISLKSLFDEMKSTARFQPDRRVVQAIAHITTLITGREGPAVSVQLNNDTWTVRSGGQIVGHLPLYPDFPDALKLLDDWIRTLQRQGPLPLSATPLDPAVSRTIDQALSRFRSFEAAQAARLIDAEWRKGAHQPALLKAATTVLAQLAFQATDRMEIADPLPAKALAVLTVTKTLTEETVLHEESLLASAMGYSGHARRVAESLPQHDPLRAFLLRDDATLAARAGVGKASGESEYLWLLRLAHKRDREALAHALAAARDPNSPIDLGWFKVLFEVCDCDLVLTPTAAQALPPIVLLTVAAEAELPGFSQLWKQFRTGRLSDEDLRKVERGISAILSSQTSALLDRMEFGLSLLEKPYPGPFLDATTYKAYFQGYFFSSLYMLGLHYLDNLSSQSAVDAYLETLGHPTSPIAANLVQWYQHLAQAKRGEAVQDLLIKDLTALQHIGFLPLKRTLYAYRDHAYQLETRDGAIARSFLNRLDSRPAHLKFASSEILDTFYDIGQAEALAASAVQADPTGAGTHLPWYANFEGDTASLFQMAGDPVLDVSIRLRAIEYLAKDDEADTAALMDQYKRILADSPHLWKAYSSYIAFLEHRKQYAEARRVAAAWLQRRGPKGSLDDVEARKALARQYDLEGRYQDAWNALQPAIKSYQAGAMERGALLLEKLADPEAAEKLGQLVAERYPDNARTRAILAEIYWRHGKPDIAAAHLASSRPALTLANWETDVASRFAEAFRARPVAEVLAAFVALQQQKVDDWALFRLAGALHAVEQHEAAFECLTRLKSNPSFLVYAYPHLAKWKGKDEALRWMRQQFPPAALGPASPIMYAVDETDLLWNFAEAPVMPDRGDQAWLLRAAAWVKSMDRDPRRKQLLDQYFQVAPHNLSEELGRYLLGIVTEETVLRLTTDRAKLAKAAYYLGLRAQLEGQYETAIRWFRTSVEAGSPAISEYNWSLQTLRQWVYQAKSLRRLAAEKAPVVVEATYRPS